MKFTKSFDGVLRASINIPARLSKYNLTQLMCCHLSVVFQADDPRMKNYWISQKEFILRLKDKIYQDGMSSIGNWRTDNVLWNNSIELKASKLIDKMFPKVL